MRPEDRGLPSVNRQVLSDLLGEGENPSPRGESTRELIGGSFQLSNPRERLIRNPTRRWSIPLAVGELLWHLSGSKDGKILEYYASVWAKFVDERGVVAGSCYGHKMMRPIADSMISAWESVLQTLRDDPDSRRAVLFFGDPGATAYALDVACVNSFQVLNRRGTLHGITTLRSSDAYLGLPYDAFVFSALQELAADILDLKLGTYTQFAGSIHCYERDIKRIEQWLDSPTEHAHETPAMSGGWQHVEQTMKLENTLRSGEAISKDPRGRLGPFWAWSVEVLQRFSAWKHGYECPMWARRPEQVQPQLIDASTRMHPAVIANP